MASGSLRGNARTGRHPKSDTGAHRFAPETAALRKARDELHGGAECGGHLAEILWKPFVARIPVAARNPTIRWRRFKQRIRPSCASIARRFTIWRFSQLTLAHRIGCARAACIGNRARARSRPRIALQVAQCGIGDRVQADRDYREIDDFHPDLIELTAMTRNIRPPMMATRPPSPISPIAAISGPVRSACSAPAALRCTP